ncbi:MAG: hypothetical protein H0T79_06245, partial [Deltaproteobacteria bacterium]|nr:hypothetical protein [Deltaproteobacteria bacterium]
RVITAASQLNASEWAQALAALRRSYGATLASVTDGLANADDHQLNYRTYTYGPTNTALTVVEFGAGDTSVGTVYRGATLDIAGVIEDSFIYGCALFAAR